MISASIGIGIIIGALLAIRTYRFNNYPRYKVGQVLISNLDCSKEEWEQSPQHNLYIVQVGKSKYLVDMFPASVYKDVIDDLKSGVKNGWISKHTLSFSGVHSNYNIYKTPEELYNEKLYKIIK